MFAQIRDPTARCGLFSRLWRWPPLPRWLLGGQCVHAPATRRRWWCTATRLLLDPAVGWWCDGTQRNPIPHRPAPCLPLASALPTGYRVCGGAGMIEGAKVTVVGQPERGWTLTDRDGAFACVTGDADGCVRGHSKRPIHPHPSPSLRRVNATVGEKLTLMMEKEFYTTAVSATVVVPPGGLQGPHEVGPHCLAMVGLMSDKERELTCASAPPGNDFPVAQRHHARGL